LPIWFGFEAFGDYLLKPRVRALDVDRPVQAPVDDHPLAGVGT
jgi:hypothetical protein